MRKASIKTRADQIRFLGSRPPVAAPGEKFEYSNAGYLLLDAIVEAVSGEGIEEYVRTHIYAPLGMSRGAEGESTASDLLRFSEGLRSGKVVAAKTLATMMAPQVKTADPEISYGYGVRVQTVNGTRIVGHPGGGPTVSAQFDIYPDEGRTVVVLSRREGTTAQRVANRLRELITQR
jgi:CubicO group peptidase (beta-lactamase class C family)